MDPSLQALLHRLDHLSEQFRELREGVRKAVNISDEDPEMALTRARKVLEYVVREVYERRVNEPPGTRPLENLLQRLVKDGYFPPLLEAYANSVRMLGNVGTHKFGENITVAAVYQSLTQLMPILEWYFEVEHPEAAGPQAAPPKPATVKPLEPPATTAPGSPVAVVPKGLRSFDAKDADFFLDLLPGPRDKDGLPESIRFWKHRVEERDEPTFTVGVIYGPSGCGKSSLVKAGLLPRLARHVLPVYVEATADDTEARLLKGLRKRCPSLPGDLDLTGTMTTLRQGVGLSNGQKLVLVLDQFEQWLHARRGEEKTELAQALRQCDGEHVQCVVMVRDDFWMALTRFMSDLHIELVQGQHIAPVDLFDPIHARNVVIAFGRAFGRLHADLSREQVSFLDQAVAGLSQDGRVISVRLALFAEMVKGKPWTPATLNDVGGTEGVGVSFLEETFGFRMASPRHRSHQEAARAVLKALLPEQGTDIKGHLRSYEELLVASGKGARPRDFEALLRILDGELRLITPTDPDGEEEASVHVRADAKYYQLTHDYLVPALREWLTRKQKETREGRAELLLEDCANLWTGRRLDRPLPTLEQWKEILRYTQETSWTERQREMMDDANAYHARSLWGRLLDANTAALPAMLEGLVPYRRFIDAHLRQASHETRAIQDPQKQLHASLALLPGDATQVDYLYGRLLDAEPQEMGVIRGALRPHKERFVERLWAVLEHPEKEREHQLLRAACALAAYDDASDGEQGKRWAVVSPSVADRLLAAVQQNPSHFTLLLEALRPVRDRLLGPLSNVFRSRERGEAERSWATSILAEYAADTGQVLADLLMDADEKQFAVFYPKFKERSEQGVPVLTSEVDKKPPSDLPSSDERRDKLAKRQANAAVGLLRMNEAGKVWPLLKHSPDPRVRSYLIHRLVPLGADAGVVIKRLEEESDLMIRRALILSLGECGKEELSPDARNAFLPKLQAIYRTDTDPGLHAAAEWLLRTWRQEAWLKQVNEEWAKDKEQRKKRLHGIRQLVKKDKEKTPPQWYVNGEAQTMVVIPGPVELVMGSPTTEAGRGERENRHRRQIGRSFVLGAQPVTLAQFKRYYRVVFERDYDAEERYTPTDECPVNYTSWFQAAAYCNWLSEQEDIANDQWCYETNRQGEMVKLKESYLSLTGYRLPTEAEWEYACRAGAVTSLYYGETEELLPNYGWYLQNGKDRAWPVGGKKPNDLGLFDMHGNVFTWCQDSYKGHPALHDGDVIEDKEDNFSIVGPGSRVLRGGSFSSPPMVVRSACRLRFVPTNRVENVGFRPARTFR